MKNKENDLVTSGRPDQFSCNVLILFDLSDFYKLCFLVFLDIKIRGCYLDYSNILRYRDAHFFFFRQMVNQGEKRQLTSKFDGVCNNPFY